MFLDGRCLNLEEDIETNVPKNTLLMKQNYTKLFILSFLSFFSAQIISAQVVGDVFRDINPVIDVIAVKDITLLESDNLLDEEMNDFFSLWQKSLEGVVQRRNDIEDDETILGEGDIVAPGEVDSRDLSDNDAQSRLVNQVQELKYVAYPNPAKNFITLDFDDEGYHEISLYNVVGQLESYYQVFEQNTHTLDVSTLPTGMYLLQVTDGAEMKTKRVQIVK